jgi:acyl carrier protein
MKPADETVREVIAAHLEIPLARVQPGQHLERDLDLHPLDVVLVALKLEEEAHVRFEGDELETVATVHDLALLVDAAA